MISLNPPRRNSDPNGRRSRPKHVLLVEIERGMAFGLRYNLEADGYRVTTHADSLAAAQLMIANDEKRDAIDLVAFDLDSPLMEGITLFDTLRSSRTRVPLVVFSSRPLRDEQSRGYNVSADEFISKPFDLDQLLKQFASLTQAC